MGAHLAGGIPSRHDGTNLRAGLLRGDSRSTLRHVNAGGRAAEGGAGRACAGAAVESLLGGCARPQYLCDRGREELP